MKTVFCLVKNEIAILVRRPKIWLALLMTLFFAYDFMEGVKVYAKEMELGITPYTYPLFMAQWNTRIYIILIMIVILSDAPFLNGIETFTKLRISTGKMILSKIIYMLAVSFLYQICLILILTAVSLPYLGMDSEWGDVLSAYIGESFLGTNTIAETGESILIGYTPAQAMVYETILMTLLMFMFGMLIFIINTFSKKYTGTIIIGVLSCLHTYINDYMFFGDMNTIAKYVPMSWINLAEKVEGISVDNMIIILLAADVMLFIVTMLPVKMNLFGAREMCNG